MNKVKNGIFLNIAGSVCYLFSQWLMSILVVRLSGNYEDAGVLSIAISSSAIFSIVSNYNMRSYQVADINNTFSDGEYIICRYLTCFLSVIMIIPYLIVTDYSINVLISILGFMFIRVSEALADVFHGVFQKKWRWDIVCKSMILRSAVNLIVFYLVELFTKELHISLLAVALSLLMCVLAYDYRICRHLYSYDVHVKFPRIRKLLKYTFALFLYGLISNSIANIPRLWAEGVCGEEQLGYYASIAAPTVVVQTFSTLMFSTIIPLLSEQFYKKNRKIYKTIGTVILATVLVGSCALLGFGILGEWLLKLLFNEELIKYSFLLIPTVVVSILMAFAQFVSSLFVVVDKKNIMLAIICASFLVVVLLSKKIITAFGIRGINYVLMISYLLFIFVGFPFVLREIHMHITNKAHTLK